jgi:hypothetical protein
MKNANAVKCAFRKFGNFLMTFLFAWLTGKRKRMAPEAHRIVSEALLLEGP